MHDPYFCLHLLMPSVMLQARRGDAFDFTEEDAGPSNRTDREYLFYTSHSTRCYDTSG